MTWAELVIHSPQPLNALLRCITAELAAFQHQQAVYTSRRECRFLVLAKDHGQYRALFASHAMGQAQQIAVMTAQAAADHVGGDANVERRLYNLMQWQLHFGCGRAFDRPALLRATTVNALD